MQKMSKIFLALTTAICGLFCGCYDGETECYDSRKFVSLNFLTTDGFDSIYFYLNENRVCYENIGVYYDWVLCRQDSNQFLTAMEVSESDISKCISSDEDPIWKGFHCFIGEPSDRVDVGIAKMRAQIFYKNEITWMETPLKSWGGDYVNIVAEHDTSRWFAYNDNPIRPYFDEFRSPASSNRAGCYDGYCVATLPIVKEEFCFDLSN